MTKQKIAIVTGGGSGIGYGIAEKFTSNGVLTYITGRNLEKLERAKKALGENCRITQLDMEHLNKFPAFVQNIADKHGRIDTLVNNAGINLKQHFLELSDEAFQKIILTNLTAVFSLSREVAKIMVKQGSGSIVHISSMAAHYGIPKVVGYTAAKTGLEGLAWSMAVDLSPMGVRVNCVAPGYITTPMTKKVFNGDPQRKAKVLDRTPMGKMGNPSDIANAVYFLASEEASFITGEVIKVDGGNSIGF